MFYKQANMLLGWEDYSVFGEVNGPPYLCYVHYEIELYADCKHNKGEERVSKGTIKYYLKNVYKYFDNFGY